MSWMLPPGAKILKQHDSWGCMLCESTFPTRELLDEHRKTHPGLNVSVRYAGDDDLRKSAEEIGAKLAELGFGGEVKKLEPVPCDCECHRSDGFCHCFGAPCCERAQ